MNGGSFVERERAAGADARHARQRAEALLEVAPVLRLLRHAVGQREREAVERHVGAEGQHVLGAEAWIKVLHLHQAAQHQAGGDKQHERGADLRDDQHAAQALARRAGATAVAQRRPDVDAL